MYFIVTFFFTAKHCLHLFNSFLKLEKSTSSEFLVHSNVKTITWLCTLVLIHLCIYTHIRSYTYILKGIFTHLLIYSHSHMLTAGIRLTLMRLCIRTFMYIKGCMHCMHAQSLYDQILIYLYKLFFTYSFAYIVTCLCTVIPLTYSCIQTCMH